MSVTTLEGIVKNGKIAIDDSFALPEATRVYVIVPDSAVKTAQVTSPRLVDPAKIKEFEREISDIRDDEI